MANVPGLPKFSQPLVDVGGATATAWYRFWSNLANVTVTVDGLQAEIDALNTKIDNLPAATQVRGQLSIAQSGATGGIVSLTLVGDTASPGNRFRYGTDNSGNKGWLSVLSDFAATANVTVSAAGTGIVSFNTVQDIQSTSTPTFAQVTLGADATLPLQATTLQQMQAALNGLSWKAPCLAATTANITLSGVQTIDGIIVTAGQRVLVKNQTTAANNGIYVVSAGAWTRSTDMNTWAQVPNASVFVQEGTVAADTSYTCTSDPGGTIGTTAITWVQFNGGGGGGGGGSNGVGLYSALPVATSGSSYQCTDCPLRLVASSAPAWVPFNKDELIVLPPASISNWLNQGTATVSNAGPFPRIRAPALSGTNLRIRYKALAVTSNYTITALVQLNTVCQSFMQGGICLFNTGGNPLVGISMTCRTGVGSSAVARSIDCNKWTSPTAFSTNLVAPCYSGSDRVWMRIQDDGTNRIYSISIDGISFLQLGSESRTAFVTPNAVGFFGDTEETSFSLDVMLISFSETTP